MTKPIKTIFVGTPEFSVPYLQGLLADPDFLVTGVITQPDKPLGRKQILTPSPIKLLAQSNGLTIWQPEKLRKDEYIVEALRNSGAELMVVVAYGQIIPQAILDLFPLGAINVHPSLLPKYRGASPIQNTILNGDKVTGVSIMLMDAQMDHGPILAQEITDLDGEETNESLHFKLATTGVPLLITTIKNYLNNSIVPQPQIDAEATFCQMITKEDAKIDWNQSATAIKQKIYAFYPWPATWTMLDGQRFKIFPTVEVIKKSGPAGQIEVSGGQLIVYCGTDALQLHQIQLEGKKQTKAEDFIRGYKIIDSNL